VITYAELAFLGGPVHLGGADRSRAGGLTFIDPDALPGYVTALDRDGFSVHFHAIGDRAVRLALDAVAAARAANGMVGRPPSDRAPAGGPPRRPAPLP
jgi:predicted amidohydrolase YtcJ